jgi:hypothetical protein
MHPKSAHPQGLTPRLPQRLVRRNAIQSVQVLQAAADQSAYQTAYCTANGAADAGGFTQQILRGLVWAIIRFSPSRSRAARTRRRWRWGRRRVFGFVAVWHVSSS